MEFTATTRVPVRPLSYQNRDMAYKKELLIDYTNGMVYVVDMDGNIISITDQLYNLIINDPKFSDMIVKNIFLKIPKPGYDPENPPDPDNPDDDDKFDIVELTVQILRMIADIEAIKKNTDKLKEFLDKIRDDDGNVAIKASDIILDKDHQFVTSSEKENLAKKIHIVERVLTVDPVEIGANSTEGEDPFEMTATVAGVDPSYPSPLADIQYTTELVETGEAEDVAFGCMHRIFITAKDTVRITFSEKPETIFKIKFLINTPGI